MPVYMCVCLRLLVCCTCKHGSMASQQGKVVHEGREDALHGAKHGAEAQVKQHKEEERRPERAGWKQSHSLSEGDERKTCTLHTLEIEEKPMERDRERERLTMSRHIVKYCLSHR